MSVVDESPAGTVLPEIAPTRHVEPPTGEREPLKVNIYERMSKSNAQLIPIFPYDDAGAVVPCGAVLYGGAERSHPHFFHWNTVSELLVAWGSNEAMIATGALMATQPFHGVNSFLRDEKKEGTFALVTITQRQSCEAGQREALTAKCESCKKDILKFEYDSAPYGAPDFEASTYTAPDDLVRQFSTQWGGAEFAKLRNSDEVRICQHCGHENSLFEMSAWGWDRMVNQTSVANAAARSLEATAQQALG